MGLARPEVLKAGVFWSLAFFSEEKKSILKKSNNPIINLSVEISSPSRFAKYSTFLVRKFATAGSEIHRNSLFQGKVTVNFLLLTVYLSA
jgi:hypothetical protein